MVGAVRKDVQLSVVRLGTRAYKVAPMAPPTMSEVPLLSGDTFLSNDSLFAYMLNAFLLVVLLALALSRSSS
jgi:hypothetical protein